jgi:prepilin-type N-terminal cleavage/methylation domain-containing protein
MRKNGCKWFDKPAAAGKLTIPARGPWGLRFCSGFTLVELSITTVIFLILILVVGVVLVSGNRAWLQTFASANKQTKQDAMAASIAFGSMGRKSNRLSYIVYKMNGDSLIPAKPKTADPQEVVWGDAVEFRYWDVPLDKTDSHKIVDVDKPATAYALFYIDGDELKVDYGPYPPGAAPAGGGARNTAGVTTRVLAENVSTETGKAAFSHTTLNGMGQGAVRINVTLTDPADEQTLKVMTATLMRNLWPR